MNILFITPEAVPFAKSGGLGDVAGALPKAANKMGADMRVIMPLYKAVKEKYGEHLMFLGSFDTKVAWRTKYCGIFTMDYDGVVYYFIDNEEYFNRDQYYGHYDDGERFAYFSRAVMDALIHLDFKPDILHCSEWQTALVPVYLKTIYSCREEYSQFKTVFTIHNIEYQGKYGIESLSDVFGLGMTDKGIVEYGACINLMKGAIVCCDRLNTVSPTYAGEILYSYYANGLDKIISENSYKLRGILNGIDTETWNPWFDRNLKSRFSANTVIRKRKNKEELQKELGLEVNGEIPVIGMVTRLASHKGLDLVLSVFDELMTEKIQFVLLGSGDKKYESFFHNAAERYPGRVSVTAAFSGELSSRIYGGSDIFLMPSISEPCGLSQMIAARYGAIPVVRSTGGLYDSIKPYNRMEKAGNGVTFGQINAHDMLGAIKRAIELYYDKEHWPIITDNAMRSDFSWKKGATAYIDMYNEIL